MCNASHCFWRCGKYKELTEVKKLEFVKALRICFNCFQAGHTTPSCPFSNTCLKYDCRKKHHTSLHAYFTGRGESRKPGNRRQRQKAVTKFEEDEVVATMIPTDFSAVSLTHQLKDTFLQIVPLILHGNEGTSLKTFGLLDECSMSTFIREEAANKLKLCTVNRSDALIGCKVSLQVSSRDCSRTFDVRSAYIRPSSCFNMPAKPNSIDSTDAFKHLEGIKPDAATSNDIGILIGADVPDAVLKKGFLFGLKEQPLAVDTAFGWTPSIHQARRRLWQERVKEHGGYARPVSSLYNLEDNLMDC